MSVSQERRGQIMLEIIKRRGRPFNDTVADFAREYHEIVAREIYPGDDQTSEVARKMLVNLNMSAFDADFIANYTLFGKWLRQG